MQAPQGVSYLDEFQDPDKGFTFLIGLQWRGLHSSLLYAGQKLQKFEGSVVQASQCSHAPLMLPDKKVWRDFEHIILISAFPGRCYITLLSLWLSN